MNGDTLQEENDGKLSLMQLEYILTSARAESRDPKQIGSA